MENETNELEGGFLPLLPLYQAYKLTKLIPLRKSFNLSDSAFLKAKGNWQIVKMSVCRSPIQNFLGTTLNLLTLGKFQQAVNKYGFDKLFHLYLEMEIAPFPNAKTTTVIFEKNETPRVFQKVSPSSPDTQCRNVVVPSGLTLNSFIENSIARMGKDNFYTYNAFTNNCQVQIIQSLGANNMLTPDLEAFIKQDTESIAKELPQYSKDIVQGTTDLARRLRTITGQGLY